MNISVNPTANVDLSNCAREPIHIIGTIQDFGFLLAFAVDSWTVCRASRNAARHLDVDMDEILGKEAEELLTRELLHRLRNAVQVVASSGTPERFFDVEVRPGLCCDVAVHLSGKEVVVECEPRIDRVTLEQDPVSLVRTMTAQLERAEELDDLMDQAARKVRAITGYDRVMIYKFLHDGSGEVVAEAARSDIAPFKGLRYPASDIPQQARALYRKNLVRVVGDVNAEPVPIIPERDDEDRPLDLSLSILRSVSPIHLEYLRNMGVAATLTVSILKGGELWGLIACHHLSPRRLGFRIRTATELFAQLFALQLESRQRRREHEEERAARMAHDRLLGTMAPEESVFDSLQRNPGHLRSVIESDGVAVWINGRLATDGIVPPAGDIEPLVYFLNALSDSSGVFATECLSAQFPRALDYASDVSGLLAISISRPRGDYLMFFRKELVRSVTWGGDPEKAVEVGAKGARLTPRRSFEAYVQEVRCRSKPWDLNVHIASMLRTSLLDVVIRRVGHADKERREAQERQEILIAELNHRVKNTLGLIRALVSQSRSGTTSLSHFTENLESRIQSLAAAHDQLTTMKWQASPLRDLLKAELRPYALGSEPRSRLSGPPVLLIPKAYTALALVIHELTTNCAKYGAFRVPEGRVDVDWKELRDGSLEIMWKERGGPMPSEPTSRGFGSTIIERTVPFELGGGTEISFEMDGVRARFVLPDGLFELAERDKTERPDNIDATNAAPLKSLKTVLAVEDNMIIGLDLQGLLDEIGFENVEVAANVAAALALIDKVEFDCAVLDINLGSETSIPIAEALQARAVPFVFATGYGEATVLPDAVTDVPVIGKPYGRGQLIEKLCSAVEAVKSAKTRGSATTT